MEIWRDVNECKGYYQISDLGRVRSLDRVVEHSNGKKCKYKGIVMKQVLVPNGYYHVVFCINNCKKNCTIHRLVAEAFKEPVNGKLCVNHIDHVRTNNKASNLEWCTHRENTTLGYLRKRTTSKYTGVYRSKNTTLWGSCIGIDGKSKYLGHFESELDARDAYIMALEKLHSARN